jgi:hypothetical protein
MGIFEDSFEKAIGQLRDNTADLSRYTQQSGTGNKQGSGKGFDMNNLFSNFKQLVYGANAIAEFTNMFNQAS